MSKNYANKVRQQQAALTGAVTAAQQAAVKQVEATSFAECMAVYGLPYTVYLGEQGETSVTLMRTIIRKGESDVDVVRVVSVSDDYVAEGFNIFSDEIRRLAEADVVYVKDDARNPWAEANRFKLFVITTELIRREGGHHEFRRVVEAVRKERIIRADMKSGKLSSDVMNIARRPGLMGFETPSGHPMVFEVYRHGASKREKLYIKLIDAPFGVPQGLFRVGVYAPVSDLFTVKDQSQHTADFSTFVVSLVPEDKKEEFRQQVDDLADREALKISSEIKGITSPKQISGSVEAGVAMPHASVALH
jgi:hypothetical protein